MTKTNAQLFNHPSTLKGLERSVGFYTWICMVVLNDRVAPASFPSWASSSCLFQADIKWLPSMDQGPWKRLRHKGRGNIIGSSEHIGRYKIQTNKLIERMSFRIRLYKSKSQPPAGPVNLGINLLHLKKGDPWWLQEETLDPTFSSASVISCLTLCTPSRKTRESRVHSPKGKS